MLSVSIFLFVGFLRYYSTNSMIIDLNKTIEYYINTTKESLDLTILSHVSVENCSQTFFTLIDLISFCSSIAENTINLFESVTTLKLTNLCLSIDIKSIEKLKSIRRFIFDNCTIRFLASQQREDYDFYPKNLTRWSFNQGRTDTFDQFIAIINHLGSISDQDGLVLNLTSIKSFPKASSFSFSEGPFKFDLQLSNCFQSIKSFNDFIPLDIQFILLNITCEYFQLDEPSNIKTRTAIFLTPTLVINTQSNPCPLRKKYRWLGLKRSHTEVFPLRTLTCENRLIHLYSDIDETIKIELTTEISLTNRSTESNKWTTSILINFSVIFLSFLMLFMSLLTCLIRFLTNKSTI